MPSRKYYLVGDGSAINMRQKITREKHIRSVSITSTGDYEDSGKYNYVCEVRKSPRAPEYVIHYVKTKKDGIQMVKHRKNPHKKPPSSVSSNQSVDGTAVSEDKQKVNTEVTDKEKEDMVGLKVIACNKQDGLYYAGQVAYTKENVYAIVTFNFGKRQKVRTQMIIPMCGAIARPELAPGDFVLVQVYNESRVSECFVPGILEVPPEDSRQHNKFYSVMLYNGQRETTMRKFIVKIGKARFEMALRYITHIQQQRRERQEKTLSDVSSLNSPHSWSSRQSDDGTSSSRSSMSSRGRRKKEKLTKKLADKKENNSHKRKSSSPRSSSRSSRSSRSRSSSSRSRSRSSSKGSRSRSHSRSEESRGSSTPRQRSAREKSPYERPITPVPNPRPSDPCIKDEEKDEIIQDLQYQLEKQKRKQLRQEQRLVRQARKINKIQRKMRESNNSQDSSNTDRSDRTRSRQSPEPDISQQRRKGSPDGTSYRDSPDILSQRRSLPGLRCEQEVLARWTDDGWFYRGCVVADSKEGRYIVRDVTGYMETIARDDILTDKEHKFSAIQPEDFVIGLHPKYVFSYAPAEVLGTFSNQSVKVEFFDGNLAELTSDEVYKISKAKYEQVVDYIKKCEKNLVGKSVVARDDSSGLYKLGVVDSRVGLGQQYYVKWLDGDMSKQNNNHMFEVGKRQAVHDDWSYILAPVSQRSMVYMPGEVIQSNPLMVQFCNGRRTSEATFDQCFWLSKEYYTNARNFLLDVQQRKHPDSIPSHRD